jgi:hypothetical protein
MSKVHPSSSLAEQREAVDELTKILEACPKCGRAVYANELHICVCH